MEILKFCKISLIKRFGFIIILILPFLASGNEFSDTSQADVNLNKADRFIKEYSIDSAQIYYEKAQLLFQKANNKVGYIKATDGLGDAMARNNNAIKALRILQNNQKYIIENIGSENIYLANNYNKIAIANYFLSNINEALKYLNLSLEIKLRVLPSNDKLIADSYNNIGVMQDMNGNKDEALNAYLKAIEIIRNNDEINKSDMANTLENIAIVYYDISDYESALKYEREANDLFKTEFGENSLKYLNSYELIGVIYFNMERYKQAELLIKDAFEKKLRMLSPYNPYMINSYQNLGNLYYAMGNVNKAIELHLKAYQYLEESSETKSNFQLLNLNSDLGNDYDELNQPDLALEYYNKAIAIAEKLYNKNHFAYASLFNNISSAYTHKKNYQLAIESLIKAESIMLKNKVSDKTLCNIYNNIGFNYFYLNNQQKSVEYFNRSTELAKKIYGNNSPSVATIYHNIGSIYFANNKFNEAKDYFVNSINIRKENFGIKNPDLASSYNSMVEVLISENNYDSALIHIQYAFSSNLPKFNFSIDSKNITDHDKDINVHSLPKFEIPFNYLEFIRSSIQKISIYDLLGKRDNDLHDYFNAHKLYILSDTILDNYRRSVTNENDKLLISEIAGDLYPNAALNCLDLFQFTKDSTYIEKAYYFLQKNKSIILLETINEINAKRIAGIPDSLIQKEKELIDDISFYNRQLLACDKEEIAFIYEKIRDLNAQVQQSINFFEIHYPKYFELKYNLKPITIKQIQKVLNTNTCLLSYTNIENQYIITSITKNNVTFDTISISEDFTNTIDYYRYSLMYPESERFQEFYRSNGYELYKKLLPNDISDEIKNLIIIPDQKLSKMPFEALLTGQIINDTLYSDYPYLVKKYNISYSYADKLVYDRITSKQIDTKPYDFIAFAPVFADNNTNALNRNTKYILNNLQNSVDSIKTRGRFMDNMLISSLPGTEQEVIEIYQYFVNNNFKAKANLYKAANEKEVKTTNLNNYRFIHFATHGFANMENPELSGLILAQDSSDNEDNILFLDEILNLNLNSNLVMLSACETGLGKIYKGEGIIGLSRALIYSGAQNIGVSLWQVSDESTRELMTQFYKNIVDNNSNDFGEPLRNAKLKLIETKAFSHPFYWSPFILIGY
ncbi:MAG: hypothetical protein A2W99_03990 [Bacteroidetes bacterium GWF2_33_16]|nr:MAG: hypothetical protein A2X00_07205 [Bacteroidetes bacterium GWE2_32_14]OFY02953.1 MAG: hypothetical protein A2W99_03990 [Bacteroidetes bacterium GWF2_33_16]